jgi:hypothetical protein
VRIAPGDRRRRRFLDPPSGGICGRYGAGVRTVLLDAAGSFSWLTDQAELLERASTAIALPAGWLLVDPIDVPGLDERLAGRPLAAVLTLLARHRRDAARIAGRHGVEARLAAAAGGPGADVAGVEEIAVLRRPWREAALWQPGERRLVFAEALGTADYYRARLGEALGVHPLARLAPPRRALGGLRPEQICAGHGPPLLQGAEAPLQAALRDARRDLPRAWLRLVRVGRRR